MRTINVGANLKTIRTDARPKSFTAKYVVEEVNRLGYPLELKTYYKWERGEGNVPCDVLPYLSKVLRMSESAILNYNQSDDLATHPFIKDEVNVMSQGQLDLLNWICTKWQGNTLAIIAVAAMYLNLSPLNRLSIFRMICVQYEQAVTQHTTNPSCPAINIEYVKDSLKKLEEQVRSDYK